MDTYNWYGRAIKKLLFLAGLLPIANPSVFYRLLPYVHLTAELWIICAVFNFTRLHMNDFEMLIKGLGLAMSFLVGALKVISNSKSSSTININN